MRVVTGQFEPGFTRPKKRSKEPRENSPAARPGLPDQDPRQPGQATNRARALIVAGVRARQASIVRADIQTDLRARIGAAPAARAGGAPRPGRGGRPARARFIVVTVALLAGGWSVGPAAADEDDWEISARTGIASVVVDGRDPLGIGAGLDLQYGLDDAWAVRISGSGGRHGVDADPNRGLPGGTIWSYSAFAGLNYTMDVLRLLPTFELGIGYLGILGAVRTSRRSLGVQAGIGADYLWAPRFTVGAKAEYVFAPFDLVSNVLNGTQTPQAFSFSFRLGWILN
jgi:hypothetical protein